MLLRNNGEANSDIFQNMSSPSPTHQENLQQPPPHNHNTYHTGHDDINNSSSMDDVWGDDDHHHTPTHTTTLLATPPATTHHVSDIPRLKQEHTTSGYRDGVTVAKAASVQAGFDEGYGLGATIGAHAGRLLGVLTGLTAACQDNSEHLATLLETATSELSVQSIFGETYWAPDGTWKYEVVAGGQSPPQPSSASFHRREAVREEQGANEQQQQQGDGASWKDKFLPEEEENLVFADIAAAHPLLRKWDGIVQGEAERYGLVWDVLLPEAEEAQDQRADEQQRLDDVDDAAAVVAGGGGADKDKKTVRGQTKGSLAW